MAEQTEQAQTETMEKLKSELEALKKENEELKKNAVTPDRVSLTDVFALLQQARGDRVPEAEEDGHGLLADWISYDEKIEVFKKLLEEKMGITIERKEFYTSIRDTWDEEEDRCGCEGTSSYYRCCGEEPSYNMRD